MPPDITSDALKSQMHLKDIITQYADFIEKQTKGINSERTQVTVRDIYDAFFAM